MAQDTFYLLLIAQHFDRNRPPLGTNQSRVLLVKTSKITQQSQDTNQNIKSVPRGHKQLTMREQVLPRGGTWSGSSSSRWLAHVAPSLRPRWRLSPAAKKVQAVFHRNYIACGDIWSQRGFPTVELRHCGHSTRIWCHPSKGLDPSHQKNPPLLRRTWQ